EAFPPQDVGKHRQTERPEDHEADHHQHEGDRRPFRFDNRSVHRTSPSHEQSECGPPPITVKRINVRLLPLKWRDRVPNARDLRQRNLIDMALAEQPGGILAAMWRPLRLETLVRLR